MPNKELHIIAFDVPYPPDYGGAIDVFFKIRALHRAGARLHLHCFVYGGRGPAPELETCCASIHYYQRSRSFFRQLSLKPFIVRSRLSRELENRLSQDDLPILFEGLHTCGLIGRPIMRNRQKLIRMHNIEWQYYRRLARLDRRFLHRIYLETEGFKLRFFEPWALRQASAILAISQADSLYFRGHSDHPVLLLPAFHGCETVESATGTGDFALFHGNLEVPDNEQAAIFLLEQVLPAMDFPLVIAGRRPSVRLQRLCARLPRARLVADPTGQAMERLMHDAQIHLLYSYQPEGLKLKLLQALHRGRFVIANRMICAGTGLEPLCHVADSGPEMGAAVRELCRLPFREEIIQERQSLLSAHFSDKLGAQLILDQLP